MNVDGKPYRPIWEEGGAVVIIDQTKLPFAFETTVLASEADAARAIADMQVRGAPLIGATAAYGLALAMRADASDANLGAAYDRLLAAAQREQAAFARARAIADEDVEINRRIGENGLLLIEEIAARKGRVNVLTHCNAGWLATCDWGTATAPIYMAHDAGIDVHVWVDETRPRNQGAFLTAWELHNHGVPHTVIVDNAGGHLMQKGEVDICFVGTDRTTASGDVCNKIGTYLKALAAKDNGVPFYVCLPSPTIDWSVRDGAEIPIEARGADEVTMIQGQAADGAVETRRIVSPGSDAFNPAFDVTPARLVTGLVTERGIAEASTEGLAALFPDRAA